MSLIFAARDNTNAVSWLLPGLTVVTCSATVWILYLKSYHLDYIQDLSYRRLLTNLEYEDNDEEEDTCKMNLRSFLIKHHYLILYLFLILFAVVNSSASITSGMEIILLVSVLAWALMVTINRHYLRTIHTVRNIINSVVLCVCLILLILQSINISNPQQTSTPAIIGLVFISSGLTINVVVFVRVEYRRRRGKGEERKKEKNKMKINFRAE